MICKIAYNPGDSDSKKNVIAPRSSCLFQLGCVYHAYRKMPLKTVYHYILSAVFTMW